MTMNRWTKSKWWMQAACAVMLSSVLVACGPKEAPTKDGNAETASAKTEPDAAGDLDVAAFKGGYDIDFFEAAGKEFAEKNPGKVVKVWGSPRVWEQLRTKILAGDTPDLMYPGWGMDHWALADEDQLMVLNDALKGKPYAGDGTWGDTFEPQILKLGQRDGKQYVLPYFFNVQGWWYDPNKFKANGWTPPKTYEELLVLGEKIKAKGMAPITFQGQYPYYMIEGMLLPWCVSAGGIEALRDAQNLKPGAWKSPAMLKAAQMIAELKAKGFFQEGAVAMSHTESQTEFLNGRAAMIPCGTWLYSEMKKSMPADAAMEYTLPPVLASGKGDATAIAISIEPWMIPTSAKRKNTAIDFFKYMTSLDKAKQFVREKGTLMAIKGSDETEMLPAIVKAAGAFKSSKTVWSPMYRQWYTAFNKVIEDGLTSMLNGELTPEQFCDRCEEAAEKTRNDSSITKHTVE